MEDSAIFQKVYLGGTRVKLGFWVGIGTLGGTNFFQVGLENSLYKKKDVDMNKEYGSQTKKWYWLSFLQFLIFGPLPLQLSSSLYLYPYFTR